MFLLDTDHLVIIQRRSRPEYGRILDRMNNHSPSDFFVSIVSFHEQVSGWNAYIKQARSAASVVGAYGRFESILADFTALQVVPYDDAAAQRFDSLRNQRVRIGTMDLRIASTALTLDFTLLTRNAKDFCKVPGLRFEDWTA